MFIKKEYMISLLYKIYQIFVGLPLVVIMTIITALEVGIGTTIGNGHFWGYYPGRWWAKIILWTLLIPVKVEGTRNWRKAAVMCSWPTIRASSTFS